MADVSTTTPASIQRMCDNHPDRRAIGVCVETHKPICAECSTRYQGVNYSKQGLAIRMARRSANRRRSPVWFTLFSWGAVLLVPLWIYMGYLFFHLGGQSVIDIMQTMRNSP